MKTNGTTTEEIQRIPLADLQISERNTRHPKPSEPGIGELALSIKNAGQTTPAIVRPHPKKKGGFEIAAGARRFVAAGVAGLKDLACVVRPLDDNAFEELILIENLQREDPDPRAEVELIDRLVKRGIHTAEQISAHLGKTKNWAERRIQLLKVIPEIRKQWGNETGNSNTSLAHFNVAIMELVGSLPVETQKLFLSRDNWQLRRCSSLTELKRALNEHVFCRLDQAPFDLNDKRFFVKGCGPGCACDSSALQSLFNDGKKEPARCLNLQCFKQRLALAQKAKYEEVAGKESLPIVKTNWNAADSLQIGEKRVNVSHLSSWEATISDKPVKNGKKSILLSTDGKMKLVYVAASTRSGATREKTKSSGERLKERKNILQGKRWHLVHDELAKALLETPHTKVTENVVDLVAFFGLPDRAHPCYGSMSEFRAFDARKKNGWPVEDLSDYGRVRTSRANEKTREAALWHNVRAVLLDIMKPVGNVGDNGRYAALFKRIAALIKFPIDERKREADKKILPPKTWGPVDVHTLEPVKGGKQKTLKLNSDGEFLLAATRGGRRHYVTGKTADEGKWTKFKAKARKFSAAAAKIAKGKSKAEIVPA